MNYGNRNASSPQTNQDILFGYSAAVLSSITIGVGLKKIFASSTKSLTGGKAILVNSMLSYVAVASAGFLNSFCMRMGEMKRGIKIYDDLNDEHGISKISAEKAVYQTSFSRILLSAPTFVVPGISFYLLDRFNLIPKAKGPKTLLELTVVACGLYFALPVSVSLFPQLGTIETNKLEQEFRGRYNKNGVLIDKYYYNKGL